MATILTAIVIGLALLAIMLGASTSLQSNNDETFTSHTLTQAQIKAWNGVDDFRQFLYQMGTSAANLTTNSKISISGTTGISGTIVDVSTKSTYCSSGTQITADIKGTSAESSSTVRAVYCVQGGGSSTTTVNTFTIEGNVTLGGSVNVVNSSTASLVVDGDITGSGSVGTFNLLYATGDINLTGAVNANTVSAEGDVTIKSSGVTITNINAMGNVDLSGGVQAINVTTNGKASYTGGVNVVTTKAIGDTSLDGGGSFTNVYTDGNVTFGTSLIQLLRAEKNFKSTNPGNKVNDGQVGGSVTLQNSQNILNVVSVPGLKVPLTPLTPSTITTTSVDAWPLKSSANLVFDVDSANRKIVTVKNMIGMTDGTYFLTGDSSGHNDYLCSSSTYNASSCYKKICQAYSDWNSCFTSYKGSDWTIAGDPAKTTLVPGALWFHGDVNLGTGTYYNTVIATGNITTSGQASLKSPNYAGYAPVCTNSTFGNFYPGTFCSAGAYVSDPLGNIALYAGGYVNGVFSGGNITLTSSNAVYGDVIAGGILTTSGNTTIYGYVTVANEGHVSSGSSMGASTTIDLSNLPPTYDPDSIPSGDDTKATIVGLLWTRYL